jgi:hypothetical protein
MSKPMQPSVLAQIFSHSARGRQSALDVDVIVESQPSQYAVAGSTPGFGPFGPHFCTHRSAVRMALVFGPYVLILLCGQYIPLFVFQTTTASHEYVQACSVSLCSMNTS